MSRLITALSLMAGMGIVAGCANDTGRDHTSPMYTAQGPSAGTSNLTQTCAYKDGPLAGQTIDYTGTPGASAVQVGVKCADMNGSSGVAVAPQPGREQGGRLYTSPGAPNAPGTANAPNAPGNPNAWSSSGTLNPGYSLYCQFNSGPAAGHTADYSSTLGAQPVAIGAACSDGPNSGVAVAQSPGSTGSAP
jgi:hypothetical protein